MSKPGCGRGGRGAALLQALNSPVRKPGEMSTPPQGSSLLANLQREAAAKPIPQGRGAAALSGLSQASAMPQPVGRGAVPRGRAAALYMATNQPVGRGMALALKNPCVTTEVKPQAQPQSPQTMESPAKPVKEPGRVKESGDDKPETEHRRLTSLEYGLKQLDLNREVVSCRGEAGRTTSLKSNYIRLTSRNEGVYQYAASFSPAIDSVGMRKKLLLQHIDALSPAKAFDGSILFLPIKLQEPETMFKSLRPSDNAEITIKVKLVKVVPHSGCIPVYNIVFRRIMNLLQLVQVGRHHYDPHKAPTIPQHRLEVWPGYITTISDFEGGLMLQCDVSHRVLRTETVLMLMRDIHNKSRNFKEAVTRILIGCTVLTRYNNKTYRIDDIAWDMTPASKFPLSTGEEISFADYYFKNYKKKIQDLQQPMLIHRPKKKDYIISGRRPRRDGKEDLVCLVPELSYMTGLTDEMRQDFRVMKDLASHTRVTPNQRESSLKQFTSLINSQCAANKELENWGLRLETDTISLPGRVLPTETIYFGRNKKVDAGDRADWSRGATNEAVLVPVDLEFWMILYTSRDKNCAMDYVQTTLSEAPKMGIRVRQPTQFELPNDRVDTYLRTIQSNLNNQVQMVVMVFPTSRDDRYNAVKKLCNVERPVPSQVIISKTINRKPKLRSVTQKIILQINAKLGGELWGVAMPIKKIMIIGIDVYHDGAGGSKKSYGGFVASMNEGCTRWLSKANVQMPGQELMDGLKMSFLSAIREFHKVNHGLPEKIVVYRDGVGDGQIKYVADHEVSQLEDCFHHFGEGYIPRLAVIVVQKRINTRIFGHGRGGLDNPPPGTIIDHTITRKSWYDFFLVSQHVGQGTVSPTHYIVCHDSGDWKVDHLQRLTYKMTHLYYNWPGTIRVPAPCQYAHRLAYQVGQNLRKEPALELCDRLFYL